MHELWQSFKAYTSSLGYWGWAMIVGFLSGVGGLIADYFGESPMHMPFWAWWLLIIVSLIVAPFIAYHKLYQHYMKTRPLIKAVIQDPFFGEDPETGNATFVTRMQIRNTGEPTAILSDHWRVFAILPDGKRELGEKRLFKEFRFFDGTMPSPLLLPSGAQPQPEPRVIRDVDAIYNKTLKPIPKGGFEDGYIVVTFPTISRSVLQAPETEVVIEFCDVMEHPYRASCRRGNSDMVALGQMRRYPGDSDL